MIKKKSNKVKVDRLSVNKETITDLEGDEMEKVKGGNFGGPTQACGITGTCPTLLCTLPPGVTAVGTPGCGGKTSGKKCNP
jgi:hypothetical protein